MKMPIPLSIRAWDSRYGLFSLDEVAVGISFAVLDENLTLLPAYNPKDKDVFFKIRTIIEGQRFTYITKDCEEFWWVIIDPNHIRTPGPASRNPDREFVPEDGYQDIGNYMWEEEVAAIKKAVAEL